jgi:hypothetical protein
MPTRKPSENSPFLTRAQSAEWSNCSIQLIDKLLRIGTLKRYGLGRKVLVRKEELERELGVRR